METQPETSTYIFERRNSLHSAERVGYCSEPSVVLYMSQSSAVTHLYNWNAAAPFPLEVKLDIDVQLRFEHDGALSERLWHFQVVAERCRRSLWVSRQIPPRDNATGLAKLCNNRLQKQQLVEPGVEHPITVEVLSRLIESSTGRVEKIGSETRRLTVGQDRAPVVISRYYRSRRTRLRSWRWLRSPRGCFASSSRSSLARLFRPPLPLYHTVLIQTESSEIIC